MPDFDGIRVALDLVRARLEADFDANLAAVASAHGIECDPLAEVKTDESGSWNYPLALVYVTEGPIDDGGIVSVTPTLVVDFTLENADAEYRQSQAVAYLTAGIRTLAKTEGRADGRSYLISPRSFAFSPPQRVSEKGSATTQTVSLELAVQVF